MSDVIGQEFEIFRSRWVVDAKTSGGFLCKHLGEGRYGTPGETLDGLTKLEVILSEENVLGLLSCKDKEKNGDQLLQPWLANLKAGDEIHMPSSRHEGYERLRVTRVEGGIVWAYIIALLGKNSNDNTEFLDRYAHRETYGREWTPTLSMILESPTFIPQEIARVTVPLAEADVLMDEDDLKNATTQAQAAHATAMAAQAQARAPEEARLKKLAKTPEYKKLQGMEKLVVTMESDKPLDWGKLDTSSFTWPEAADVYYELSEWSDASSAVAELAEAIENDFGQVEITAADGKRQYVYTTTHGVGEDTEGMLQSYAASILLDPATHQPLGIASVEYQ